MENQCAPREFNFMSCSVNPVPFASISATTFAASSPNNGSNFCTLSLTKVRTNHLRPSPAAITVSEGLIRDIPLGPSLAVTGLLHWGGPAASTTAPDVNKPPAAC